MYDRATLALYTPGSTFKVLTLASALEKGLATLDPTDDSPGRMEIGGADVVSIGERGLGKISLAKAFALSSNTVFSTFKVLTLASALEKGLATLDPTDDSPGRMEIGGADVVSIGERGLGKISLAKAFALSSNTVFGQVADGLGAEKLVATARAFGYGQQLGLDFTKSAARTL